MPKCKICFYSKTIFFHSIKNFKYFFCHNCQTLFLNPLPSQKQISSYYQKNFHYKTGLAEEKRIRQRAKIILKNLKKLNPSGKKLLDIGSGLGFFLDEANKFGLKTIGIEPSFSLYSVSINRLINTRIINKDFQSFIKRNKEKFDFITLIHVIEHLNNPKQIIQLAIKLLNKNGILYIETPNLNSHLFWTEKQNYTFLTPPDHLWIFSQKSLEKMIENILSIEIIKASTYTYSEHLMGIIKNRLKVKSKKLKMKKTNFKNLTPKSLLSNLKHKLLDKALAPLFTPFFNLGGYGSILELYIKKNY